MFRLKKQQLFFPIAAILATAGVVFFVSYGSSQVTNRAVLDISLSSDNYNASTKTFSDRSGLGNDGVSSNSVIFADGKYGSVDGAMSFDGVSDFIKINNVIVSNPNALTISAWFKKESGGSTYECVLHQNSGYTIGSSAYWLGVDDADYLTATIGANTGVGWAAGQTDIKAIYGEWYHLLATWDGSVVKVFVNGEYVKQYSLTSYTNQTSPTRIGASADSGTNYWFSGEIEGVKILNYSLSDEEVRNLYDSGRSVASGSNLNKGLVGHWSMDSNRYVEGTENLISPSGLDFSVMSSYTNLSRVRVEDNESMSGYACEMEILDASLINSSSRILFGDATSIPTSGSAFISVYAKFEGGTYSNIIPKVYTGSVWCDLNPLDGDSIYLSSYYRRFGAYCSLGINSGGPNPGFSMTLGNSSKQTGQKTRWHSPQVELKDHATPFTTETRVGRLTDLSPYSNHGNTGLEQSFSFTEDRFGKEGGSMIFNGGHVISTNPVQLSEKSSVCLWVKPYISSTKEIIVHDTPSTGVFELFQSGTSVTLRGGSTSPQISALDILLINDWNFVCANINNTYGEIYHNGELVVSGSIATPKNTIVPLYIGAHSNLAYAFQGEMDDVRLYSRNLSESEIKSLYDSYNPKTTTGTLQKGLVLDMPLKLKYTKDETSGSEIMTDRTPYSNDGQNYGATITGDGASFDGVSNFIQIGESDVLDITKSVTISFWYQIPELNVTQRLITKKVGGGTFGLGYETSFYNTNRFLTVYNNGNNRIYLYSDYINNPDDVGKYFHYTYVYNYEEGYQRAFINGEEFSGVGSFTAGYEAGSTAGAVLDIGRRDSEEAKGVLSNVLIYNRALSDDEVKMLYDRGRSDAGIIFTPEN